jgi:hypothetical protein
MFKYSSKLNIITSWVILEIIYMCFEFQMEHNICMRRLIYDLVNIFLFYIMMSVLQHITLLICNYIHVSKHLFV